MNKVITLNFSINNWGHLYSLQQAISHNNQLTGRKLSLRGRILNRPFLQNQDTPVSIDFIQVDKAPVYPLIDPPAQDLEHELGVMTLADQQLTTCIKVDRNVFEELRKNLMEYADIEGIHIIVSPGLLSGAEHWPDGETLQIVQLDYAMKGDA